MDVLVDRCAGLDVHKDTVMAVVRRPTPDGSGREQEVRQYRTFPAALRELRAWLVAERVTQVGDGGHRLVLEAGLARVGSRGGL